MTAVRMARYRRMRRRWRRMRVEEALGKHCRIRQRGLMILLVAEGVIVGWDLAGRGMFENYDFSLIRLEESCQIEWQRRPEPEEWQQRPEPEEWQQRPEPEEWRPEQEEQRQPGPQEDLAADRDSIGVPVENHDIFGVRLNLKKLELEFYRRNQ